MLQPIRYLPLPSRYVSVWTQLCYTIIYWLSHWWVWLDEIRKPLQYPKMQPASFMLDTVNIISTCLLQYLIIHHMIIKKLLVHTMSKDRTDSLHVFNKFFIQVWLAVVQLWQCLQAPESLPQSKSCASGQPPILQWASPMCPPYLNLSVDSHT